MEQQHHYFGSTALNWATADTREEVIKKLAHNAGTKIIAINRKEYGGLYCWTCRVELPHASHYDIEHYEPVRVPTSEVQQFRIRTVKGDYAIVHEE